MEQVTLTTQKAVVSQEPTQVDIPVIEVVGEAPITRYTEQEVKQQLQWAEQRLVQAQEVTTQIQSEIDKLKIYLEKFIN